MRGAHGKKLRTMARWQLDSGLLLSTPYPAAVLTLPPGLDIQSTLSPPTFRVWPSVPVTEDVIVLAEFSEIEGPVPLLSIPQSRTQNLDLNEFVVKVLSTDYLNTSGEFRVYEDTQLIQQDINTGVHVYVHYFTLYDVRARGFVRPMCLSYISADYRKLLRNFSQLREQFIVATEFLKLSNYEWFSKEMAGLIRNLEYTKNRYILAQRSVSTDTVLERSDASCKSASHLDMLADNELQSEGATSEHQKEYQTTYKATSPTVVMTTVHVEENPSKPQLFFSNHFPDARDAVEKEVGNTQTDVIYRITKQEEEEEEEESLLRHTSLESVATQLLECQHILDIIKPHMDKKEIEEDVKCLAEQVLSKPQCPLYKAMEDLCMFDEPEKEAKPTICILSLMKRNFHNMRTVQQLCGFGYVACLFKLKTIYDRYCKSFSTLIFEEMDREIYENPFNSLFIGNIPVVCFTKENCYNPASHFSSYGALCWDTQFIGFLRHGTSKVSTPDYESSQKLEAPLNSSTVSAAADCLKVFSRGEDDDDDDVERETFDKTSKNESNGSDDSPVPQSPQQGDDHIDTLLSSTTDRENKIQFKDGSSMGVQGVNVSTSLHHTTKEVKGSPRRTLVTQGSSSSGSGNGSVSSSPAFDLSNYEDIQEEENVWEEVWAVVGPDAEPRYDVINRMTASKVCRLSGLVQKFCGVSHCLMHSLLSGRPVVLAAAEEYRPMVTLYVRALSTILPHLPATHLPVLRWHTGTVTEHHLRQYRVMGVCIPERLHVQDLMSNATLNQVTVLNIETGHISGVAYSGTLVRGVEHYGRKLFHSNSALQTCLQSILISLGLKVYLFQHLLQTTNRSAGDILKGIGVAKGDTDIILYLNSIVQSQLQGQKVKDKV
ncbi:hypothetical protein Pcinc_016248 [Petrolisthes cinctipes]|uniref:UDENN FLCN/SMCR8-type domain-containing protein n=1 Tax=Petrolisthes cinctipes TaxID=88211 RepID=A0AAE1FT82_PETCI|nr:hypothetical protein Pcinc_016248 [Petrolisthes cinctipes]